MAWALLDDNFPHNPKVAHANSLHALAGYLFVCGLCYCRKYRTSGFIPETALKALGFFASPKKPTEALIASRLWDKIDGGYQVHGYLEQYDDAEAKSAIEARRQVKREAGRKGGLARAAKQAENPQANFQAVPSTAPSTIQAPVSSTLQAHRGREGEASDRNVLVLQEKKEIGPRDLWWLELLRRYPANRSQRSIMVEHQFCEIFDRDPRPDADIWAEMLEGLENALAGYEWRVKGMVPRMDRWLERKGWLERHEYAPVSTVVSEKTARNLTAMEQFIKAGER